MKITKRLVALLVALSLFLAMFAPSIVSAAEFKEGEHYILPAGEVIYEDLFVAGNRVEILGDVDGDLFVAANIIEIKGTIHGTAYLTGNYVALHGRVDRDVLALANQLWIVGSVGQDLRVMAGGTSQASAPWPRSGNLSAPCPGFQRRAVDRPECPDRGRCPCLCGGPYPHCGHSGG